MNTQPTESQIKASEQSQAQYKKETGNEPLIAPVTHGELAFASWDYQLWLEQRATPPTAQEGVNAEDVLEEIKILKADCLKSYTSNDVQGSEKLQAMYEGMNMVCGIVINKLASLSTTTGAKEGKDGWVKVEDGLPEEDVDVLGVEIDDFGDHDFIIARWTGKEWYAPFKQRAITHWQPLPSPPTP